MKRATGVDLVGHVLRHTRASWALAEGDDIATVARDLRHDVSTCVATYLHADSDDDGSRSDSMLARMTGTAAARRARARGHLRAV